MDEPSSPWRGRRVLVTGCTGFLGGAVVRELLARGVQVVGLIRDQNADHEFTRNLLAGKVHVVHGHTEDTFRIHSALAVYEACAVFHFAAIDANPTDRGTATVMEAVRRFDPRVPVILAQRDRTGRPTSDSANTGGNPPIPIGVARFGEVFGGGDRRAEAVIPATIHALLTGNRAPIPTDGPARDRVALADAARACVQLGEALDRKSGTQFHDLTFHSGWNLTDRTVATAAAEVFAGRTPNLPEAAPPVNPLGWSVSRTFPEALAETIAWYRQFGTGRVHTIRSFDPSRRAAA